jgi:hypothetical protein
MEAPFDLNDDKKAVNQSVRLYPDKGTLKSLGRTGVNQFAT